MTAHLTRRAILLGAASALALPALAEAPLTALRPPARPAPPLPEVIPAGAELIAAAGLTGTVGYAVADARTGLMLEQGEAQAALPPASVTKSITSLYALAALGPGHRFATRLIGTGPVQGGVLQGDLVLAGGGDPVLNTDDLTELARRLKQAGVGAISGGFKVWAGALPAIHEIDPAQMEHLDYNPSISGLNLNFNRVYFEWARSGGSYNVSMDARTDLVRPAVSTARMTIVDRDLPVYTYASAGGIDDWTVASSALGSGGSRWLPVRNPGLYAGDVFRSMAQAQGIDLPAATEVAVLPEGAELARLLSDPLEDLLRDMMKYSTNLTAETIGLTASMARGGRPGTLAQSARLMTDWARTDLGVDCAFVDHSGLSDASAIRAGQMVRALVAAAPAGQLRRLMKDIPLLDAEGEPLPNPPGAVVAKTGTLNFVSALSGYLRSSGGADLAFAIFCADPARRSAALLAGEEVPDGARDWNRDARRVQQVLLQRWGAVYAG